MKKLFKNKPDYVMAGTALTLVVCFLSAVKYPYFEGMPREIFFIAIFALVAVLPCLYFDRVKVGEIYGRKDNSNINPFLDTPDTFEVIEVKKGWVKYRMNKESKDIFMDATKFKNTYKFIK